MIEYIYNFDSLSFDETGLIKSVRAIITATDWQRAEHKVLTVDFPSPGESFVALENIDENKMISLLADALGPNFDQVKAELESALLASIPKEADDSQ
jgi:hypothetical protein